MGLSAHARRLWRLQVANAPNALLTLEELCEALPGRPEDLEAWVRAHVAPCGELLGEAVYRYADAMSALSPDEGEPTDASKPLTSWRMVADAVGVSVATLLRRRQEHGDQSSPYFATGDDAQAWYIALANRKSAPPRPPSRPRRPAAHSSAATDADVVAALVKLRGGRR